VGDEVKEAMTEDEMVEAIRAKALSVGVVMTEADEAAVRTAWRKTMAAEYVKLKQNIRDMFADVAADDLLDLDTARDLEVEAVVEGELPGLSVVGVDGKVKS
jgi:hypothetical protein